MLGDSDDEEQIEDHRLDRPPSYRSASDSVKSVLSAAQLRADNAARGLNPPTGVDPADSPTEDAQEEQELVEVKHPVSRSDTVLSIARRYGADVSA